MDPKLMAVARAIHLARAKEVTFPSTYDTWMVQHPWPEDRKEATALYHHGQSWMDLAVAQARAAIKAMEPK